MFDLVDWPQILAVAASAISIVGGLYAMCRWLVRRSLKARAFSKDVIRAWRREAHRMHHALLISSTRPTHSMAAPRHTSPKGSQRSPPRTEVALPRSLPADHEQPQDRPRHEMRAHS